MHCSKLVATAIWGVGAVLLIPQAAPGLENVALGKPVTHNQFYLDHMGRFAVDGDLNTRWSTPDHGTPGNPNWIRIDLGAVYLLDRFSLYFVNTGTYAGYTNVYRLSGSIDGSIWTEMANGTLVDSADPDERTHTVPLASGRAARYVLYEAIGGTHWTNLFEIEVFSSGTMVYPLAADWSDTENPMAGGRWSVNSGELPLPAVADLTATGLDTWDGIQPGFSGQALDPIFDVAPSWFKAGVPFTGVGAPTDWQLGDVVVHTGRDFDPPTNVRWHSPGGGIANLSGGVWPVRELGRHNTWRLKFNGTTLREGTIGDGDPYDRGNPFLFRDGTGSTPLSGIVAVADDKIEVEFFPVGGGTPDYAGVDFSVTFSPFASNHCYQFERDFTAASNGSESPWTCASGDPGGGGETPLPFFHTTGFDAGGFVRFPAWHPADDDETLPCVGLNIYPFALDPPGDAAIPSGASFLRPSADKDAVVSFTAPVSGTLLAEVSFTDLDPGGDSGAYCYVRDNGGNELAVELLPEGGSTGVLRVAPVFAERGDLLHFCVGPNGSSDGDLIRVEAEVKIVPYPAPSVTLDCDFVSAPTPLVDSTGREWLFEGDAAQLSTEAKWGQSACFDGGGDAVTPDDGGPEFGPEGDPFTVEFWMYALSDGASQSYLVGKSHPDGGRGWDIRLEFGEILVSGVNGWGFNIGWPHRDDIRYIELDTWYHVALSCTENRAYLFVDGVMRGESLRSDLRTTGNPFRIGWQANYGGVGFHGYIDEFRWWDRAVWTTDFEPPAYPNMGSVALAAALPELRPEFGEDTVTFRWDGRRGVEYAVESTTDYRSWQVVRPFAEGGGVNDELVSAYAPESEPVRGWRLVSRLASP